MGVYLINEYKIPLRGILFRKQTEGIMRGFMGTDKMNENKKDDNNIKNSRKSCCECQQKATPRQPDDLKKLKNRLNRMQGQLNGIGRMLDENRYCGDILTQIAAVESALQAFGHLILKEHMETCVQEKIRNGDSEVIAETLELMKKLL